MIAATPFRVTVVPVSDKRCSSSNQVGVNPRHRTTDDDVGVAKQSAARPLSCDNSVGDVSQERRHPPARRFAVATDGVWQVVVVLGDSYNCRNR